jgi:hypothetical protein
MRRSRAFALLRTKNLSHFFLPSSKKRAYSRPNNKKSAFMHTFCLDDAHASASRVTPYLSPPSKQKYGFPSLSVSSDRQAQLLGIWHVSTYRIFELECERLTCFSTSPVKFCIVCSNSFKSTCFRRSMMMLTYPNGRLRYHRTLMVTLSDLTVNLKGAWSDLAGKRPSIAKHATFMLSRCLFVLGS